MPEFGQGTSLAACPYGGAGANQDPGSAIPCRPSHRLLRVLPCRQKTPAEARWGSVLLFAELPDAENGEGAWGQVADGDEAGCFSRSAVWSALAGWSLPSRWLKRS
jgi:hypothetical protein